MAYGDNAKYIVIQADGRELPIIFPPTIRHDQMARRNGAVISAGFISPRMECYGRSETLNIESRGEKDTELMKLMHGIYPTDKLEIV